MVQRQGGQSIHLWLDSSELSCRKSSIFAFGFRRYAYDTAGGHGRRSCLQYEACIQSCRSWHSGPEPLPQYLTTAICCASPSCRWYGPMPTDLLSGGCLVSIAVAVRGVSESTGDSSLQPADGLISFLGGCSSVSSNVDSRYTDFVFYLHR